MLTGFKNNEQSQMFTLNCRGRLLVVDKPLVMGIINCTPDSFYAGSRQQHTDAILRTAEGMLRDGAAILDIGGQSTRPGSEQVTMEEEMQRILAPIEALHRSFPEAFLSIDTYYSVVASRAVTAGASIVNDISAGRLDPAMHTVVAELGTPYILMHMKGTPQTMKQEAHYEDVTREVLDFFIRQIAVLREKGITDIIIDPGFGFAKSIAHNFRLLRELPVFRMLELPLLLGLSRKSMIWQTLGSSPDQALEGTVALNSIGLLNGASILRVHDVKAAADTIRLLEAYRNA